MKNSTIVLSGVLLLILCHMQAQTHISPNSTRLAKIRVTGSQRFPAELLVTITDLKPGDSGAEDNLKLGADRLASSGMFNDVVYRWVSHPNGTDAEFQVVDTDKLFPAFFDNFVWLSHDDLLKELQKREPLFVGKIPNAGQMSDRLQTDLKGVLADLHIPGSAKSLPRITPDGVFEGFAYTVEGVKIPIVSLEFPGANAEMVPVLQRSVTESALLGSDYSQQKISAFASFSFLPQYEQRGYLKARFGDSTAKLLDRNLNSVSIQLPVQEGVQYTLSTVHWQDNQIFTTNDLSKNISAAPGVPLNKVQLEEDLRSSAKIFGTRGYMDARFVPTFDCDDQAKKVGVTIQVNEGDQYHLGNVEFQGVSEDLAAKFRKLFTLRPQDPYDSSYPGIYLTAVGRQFNLAGIKMQINEKPHRDTRTVDLVFRFSK